MRLKEFLCMKKTFGILMLLVFIAGCNDSSPVPSSTSPPLTLAISSPYRIVDFDADTLLVSDAGTNAIHYLDKSTLVPNRSVKFFGRPSGIGHYGSFLLVGNMTTGSVDVLDAEGNFQFYLGGSKELFQKVADLSIDQSAGLVYVLDAEAALVRVYNAEDGTDTGLVIGSGTLIRPTAIEVDQGDGRLMVSDYGPDPQLRVFDNTGSPIIGADPVLGSVVGFSMPQGIFFDARENVFLVEARSGEILVMDSNHNLVKALGTPPDPSERVHYYPLEVFVDDANQDVFLTDNQNKRIVVYRGGGTIP